MIRWRPRFGRPLMLPALLLLGTTLLLAQEKKPTTDPAEKRDEVPVLLLTSERPILVGFRVFLDDQPLASHWRGQVEKLFRFLDRDGDGRLDRHEWQRLTPGNAGGPSPADHDADGFVSLDEFCRWLREVNLGPLKVGVYTLSSNRYVSVGGRPTDPVQLARALFGLLDLNRDGRLDSQEIAAAEQTLRQLDQDDDEAVTVEEILRGWAAQSLPIKPGTATGTESLLTTPSLVIVDSDQAVAGAVRLVQMLYGPNEQAIPNRQLRAEHLRYPPQLFAELDRNGDGVLDGEELRGLVRRQADVEITLRLSQKGQPRPEAVFEKVHTRYDIRVDCQPEQLILRTERTQVRISASLWLALTGTQTDSAAARDKMLRNYFRSLDRDQNGYLDQRELTLLTRLYGMGGSLVVSCSFADLDRDGDGKVVESEFLSGFEPFLAMQTLSQQMSLSLLMTPQGPGLLSHLDSNGDGKLGIREWRRAAQTLRSLDRNGDGVVEWGELGWHYLLDIAAGDQGISGIAGLRPLAGKPLPQVEPRKPANAPAWFLAMDRNGDGDISRREFVGSEKEFRRLDLDGDGLISLQEALRATAVPPETKPPATPPKPQ
jgi:Ca2+-binding EF-hand superfamily protein